MPLVYSDTLWLAESIKAPYPRSELLENVPALPTTIEGGSQSEILFSQRREMLCPLLLA